MGFTHYNVLAYCSTAASCVFCALLLLRVSYGFKVYWINFILIGLSISCGLMHVVMCKLEASRVNLAMRQREHRHCAVCDYDLTGNITGICSECGHEGEENETDSNGMKLDHKSFYHNEL